MGLGCGGVSQFSERTFVAHYFSFSIDNHYHST
ncbi:hypothetical protein PseAD21_00205 [Pseudomonas sp. AD21]|nr:hypothetical protein PseAD21_00205 [Pseudomonas sp. AD21]